MIPPNSIAATMLQCASPARIRPTMKAARATIFSVSEQAPASVPVRTKNGIAISGKESMPPNMRLMTRVSGRLPSSRMGTIAPSPMANAIGTPIRRRSRKEPKRTLAHG